MKSGLLSEVHQLGLTAMRRKQKADQRMKNTTVFFEKMSSHAMGSLQSSKGDVHTSNTYIYLTDILPQGSTERPAYYSTSSNSKYSDLRVVCHMTVT